MYIGQVLCNASTARGCHLLSAGAVVMTTHTKKFAHLLDVIRQMKIDIGPACANNQMALERLKRSQLHEIQRKLFDCFIVENKEIGKTEIYQCSCGIFCSVVFTCFLMIIEIL